ncbi:MULTISPECIES: YrhB domain-containing protein [unclassified Flavobacterium]|uniref:YrhB domain-containing protein n=1 Tax=unclassified Flavobacterium TaxID=196869 RepID=UPI001F13FFC3|nr:MULTISPECIES: YrhB domain-containing protein [unclassified Flavobacterium]UMY66463.1 YrhB family protein [Flavobacterium sp. HJ-32-4]
MALSEVQMLKIANDFIKQFEEGVGLELVILTDLLIRTQHGTVFFYTSKKYLETQEDIYGIAGNAPFLVEKNTGNIIEFGTNRSEAYYLAEYEAGRWPLK